MGSNGNLSQSELSPAVGGVAGPYAGQGQLASSGAAAAWNAMAAEAKRNQGVNMGCNGPDSMYRPYSSQVRLRAEWCARGACGNAATPGTLDLESRMGNGRRYASLLRRNLRRLRLLRVPMG